MIKFARIILALSLASLALALILVLCAYQPRAEAAMSVQPPSEASPLEQMTTTILVHDFVPWPNLEKVTLLTFHGRYVKAMDENDDWLLRQPDPPGAPIDDCERFTLHRLDAGGNRIALKTCHGKYVTAVMSDNAWLLKQEEALTDCSKFNVEHQPDGKVALKSCLKKYVTPGNETWNPPWTVRADTVNKGTWELLEPKANFLFQNRLGGSGGTICSNPPDVTVDWSVGVVTATINRGESDCAGVWTSFNHDNEDHTPINFSAIFPSQIKPEYQAQITGLRLHTQGGRGSMRIVLNAFDPVPPTKEIEVWSETASLTSAPQTISFTLPLTLTEVQNINLMLVGGPGDFFAVDRIELIATEPYLDTPHRAFLWSYAQLLASWDPSSGLIRDQAYFRANQFDNTSGDGLLAAATVVAWRLGYVSKDSATQIVSKTTQALLALPDCHSLWPHFTRKSSAGTMEIFPGTEWSSIDTTIAAVALIEARQVLGLSTTETDQLKQHLRSIVWQDLILPNNRSISHGFTGSCPNAQLSPGYWRAFGLESWMVNFGDAAATGQIAEFSHTPSTYNGGGFIDELAWLFMPPLDHDRWGTMWRAYSQEAVDRQLAYYQDSCSTAHPCPPGAKEGCSCCRENACYRQLGLFGLTPAEPPDLSIFPPDAKMHYLDFGVCGTDKCIDGADPVTISVGSGTDISVTVGHPVIVPHYAGIIASLRPTQAISLWNWLEDQPGLFTPLNNAETLMLTDDVASTGATACEHVVWNARKGAWELGLQTLGWGRYLVGSDNPLYDAFRADDFLWQGYLVMAHLSSPVISIANRGGNKVEVTWDAVDGATGYQVWYAVNAPYFTPGQNCSDPDNCTVEETTSFTHAALGDPASNYTYRVRAVNASEASPPSVPPVGEFEFSLTQGSP